MGFEPTTSTLARWYSSRLSYTRKFEQDKRIELSYSDWKSDILTIVLILQDEICPSSQTSILFTKALDFSRYCCGVVGFEPTQPEGSEFTVRPTSPTVAHSPQQWDK